MFLINFEKLLKILTFLKMENEIFEGFCISKENENFIYKGEFESNLKNGFGMIY